MSALQPQNLVSTRSTSLQIPSNLQENPPPRHTRHETACTSSNDEFARHRGVAVRIVPVCTGQAAEGEDEREEDNDEADVGAEGADHVDEAEDTLRSR